MSGENRVKLSERIYERAKALWPRYLTHPFVMEMADGTLPKEKFRYYMVQDYLYLRDYVKIFAAILQKTDDFEQIRFLSGEMANTIDALAEVIDEKKAQRLCEIFENCCLFDLRFWDMVYTMGEN